MTKKYKVTIAHESVPPGEPVEYWETSEYKDGERTIFVGDGVTNKDEEGGNTFDYEGDLKGAIKHALSHHGWAFAEAGHTNTIIDQFIYAIEEIDGDEATPIDWVAELLKSI